MDFSKQDDSDSYTVISTSRTRYDLTYQIVTVPSHLFWPGTIQQLFTVTNRQILNQQELKERMQYFRAD